MDNNPITVEKFEIDEQAPSAKDIQSKENPKEIKELAVKVLKTFIEQTQRRFTFLVIGRTGVGKSSIVNTFMGQPSAKVGDFETTTFEVESFESEAYAMLPMRIVDTPELFNDDDLQTSKTDEHLQKIQVLTKEIDCLWFITKLNETRITNDEKRSIKLLNQSLGSNIWKHTILVFTFSDRVPETNISNLVTQKTNLIKQEIAKYADEQLAKSVDFVAIANTRSENNDSLGKLYTTIFNKMYENQTQSFVLPTSFNLSLFSL